MKDESKKAWANQFSPAAEKHETEETSVNQVTPYSILAAGGGGYHLMFDLRMKTGECLALPYAYLSAIEFKPEGAITLHAGSRIIVLSGRNLGKIYDGFVRQKIAFINEVSDRLDDFPESESVVNSIEVVDTEK